MKNESIGWEYKSRYQIFSLPLLHISFKYLPTKRRNLKKPVFAKGIISIGQFGCGIINISQFGFGVINISQFAIGGLVLSQFGLGINIVSQFGVGLLAAYGQFVKVLLP